MAKGCPIVPNHLPNDLSNPPISPDHWDAWGLFLSEALRTRGGGEITPERATTYRGTFDAIDAATQLIKLDQGCSGAFIGDLELISNLLSGPVSASDGEKVFDFISEESSFFEGFGLPLDAEELP